MSTHGYREGYSSFQDQLAAHSADSVLPGSMSAAAFRKLLGAQDSTTPVVVPQQFYTEVDWLAVAGTLFQLAPALAGYYFIPTLCRTFVEVFTGTATGSWQVCIGTNSAASAYNNISQPAAVTAGSLNALATLIPIVGVSYNVNGAAAWVAGAAVQYKTLLVPTGLTGYSGVVMTSGYYLKAAPR